MVQIRFILPFARNALLYSKSPGINKLPPLSSFLSKSLHFNHVIISQNYIKRSFAPVSNRILGFNSQTNINLFSRDMRAFGSLSSDWPSQIKEFLERERLAEPTPIQEKTLPLSMRQRDVVGIARTGSGKTLAFVLPAISHIIRHRAQNNVNEKFQHRNPCVLILSPTRELVNQTARVLSKFRDINQVSLVGGASRSQQIQQISLQNQDVYIATPGRFLDLANEGFLKLTDITYLVIDEADRMLDIGFEPQIREIITMLPKERQTLMWSATWPKEIQSLAEDFMRDYDFVALEGTELVANPNIDQKVEVCAGNEKFQRLIYHLNRIFDKSNSENLAHNRDNSNGAKVLIFVGTRNKADHLLVQLMRNRFNAVVMHGKKTQNLREKALDLFRRGVCRCLIATDVAARGLDIDNITHVINFDFPQTAEDYIHRIGRTARHKNLGQSITFFTESPNDMAYVKQFVQILRESNQQVPDALLNLSELKDQFEMGRQSQRRQSLRYRGYQDQRQQFSPRSQVGNRRDFQRKRLDYDEDEDLDDKNSNYDDYRPSFGNSSKKFGNGRKYDGQNESTYSDDRSSFKNYGN